MPRSSARTIAALAKSSSGPFKIALSNGVEVRWVEAAIVARHPVAARTALASCSCGHDGRFASTRRRLAMIDQMNGKAGQLAYAWNGRFTKVSGISRPAFNQHHAQTPDQVAFALCPHLVRVDGRSRAHSAFGARELRCCLDRPHIGDTAGFLGCHRPRHGHEAIPCEPAVPVAHGDGKGDEALQCAAGETRRDQDLPPWHIRPSRTR